MQNQPTITDENAMVFIYGFSAGYGFGLGTGAGMLVIYVIFKVISAVFYGVHKSGTRGRLFRDLEV